MLAAAAAACAAGDAVSSPLLAGEAAVRFVGAWHPLNALRRDALFARLAWCLASPPSPCNASLTLRVDGETWAWAGWLDSSAYMMAATAGGGSVLGTSWDGPVLLEEGCDGVW